MLLSLIAQVSLKASKFAADHFVAAVPRVTNCRLDKACGSRGRRGIGVLEPGGELCCKFREGFWRVAGHDSSISFALKNAPHHSTAGLRLTGYSGQFVYHCLHPIFDADKLIHPTAVRPRMRITLKDGAAKDTGSKRRLADLRRVGSLRFAQMSRTADRAAATSARAWHSRRLRETPLRALPRRRTDRHFGQ